MDGASETTWPLRPRQRALVVGLRELIARHGAERWLSVPIVAADVDAFPIAWTPTLDALHAVLARVAWHAYLDLEIALVDARSITPPDNSDVELRDTWVTLAECSSNAALFHVHALGNDDVAGRCALELGRAFVAMHAQAGPYRDGSVPDAESSVDDSVAALAAIYLGLGVLIANASLYARSRSEMQGTMVTSHHRVSAVGGIEVHDACLLLAIHELVRDDVPPAIATLRPEQAARVAAWRAVLCDHDDELCELLALPPQAPALTLTRPTLPAPSPAYAEPDRRRFNAGRRTFRTRRPASVGGRVVIGGFLVGCCLLPLAALPLTLAGIVVGGGVGYWSAQRRRSRWQCTDPACERLVDPRDTVCGGCGGLIAGAIRTAADRLDAEERLEEGLPPP